MIALTVSISATARDNERLAAGDMPDRWQYTEGFSQTSPADDNWWTAFGDTILNSLIEKGVANNYDVLAASRRIEIAAQTLRQTKAAYYPAFDLSGGYTKARTSGMNGTVSTPAATASYFNLGVSMNWQLDVFGKITSRAKESRAAFNATRAEFDAVQVTICAKIATAYIQLRTLQAQLAVMENHIATQRRVMEITEARHEAGLASALDVAQARTTFYSTQASITALNTSLSTTANALAVLTGTFPEEMEPILQNPAPLPDFDKIVAVGVPMDLLRRRPDIAEAEYTLAQYAAALGVAKKDFLPTISLNGSIGTSAHDAGDLFKNPSLTYAIAPTLSWTLFDGMARSASVASAKQQMLAAIDSYNSTILTAVQEVENAMATYSNDLCYIDILRQVVDESNRAFTLSIDLYKQGLSPFINVQNAQISLLQYSSELAQARGEALIALVSLYEALGGGWE